MEIGPERKLNVPSSNPCARLRVKSFQLLFFAILKAEPSFVELHQRLINFYRSKITDWGGKAEIWFCRKFFWGPAVGPGDLPEVRVLKMYFWMFPKLC